MKLRIEIKFGNDAMQTYQDARTALLKASKSMESFGEFPNDGDDGKIRDENGNTVGAWSVEGDDER